MDSQNFADSRNRRRNRVKKREKQKTVALRQLDCGEKKRWMEGSERNRGRRRRKNKGGEGRRRGGGESTELIGSDISARMGMSGQSALPLSSRLPTKRSHSSSTQRPAHLRAPPSPPPDRGLHLQPRSNSLRPHVSWWFLRDHVRAITQDYNRGNDGARQSTRNSTRVRLVERSLQFSRVNVRTTAAVS